MTQPNTTLARCFILPADGISSLKHADLVEQLGRVRNTLEIDLDRLIKHNVLPERVKVKPRQGNDELPLAMDVLYLVSAIERIWPHLQKRDGISRQELTNASVLAASLIQRAPRQVAA